MWEIINVDYQVNTLGIIYTYKCNAKCKHCCFECSPEREEKLDFVSAKRVIVESAKLGIHSLAFSGGEVFLYFDEIIDLIKIAKANKQQCACTTNGFWGVHSSEAEKKIRMLKMAGLMKLIISVDKYHQEFIDIDAIKNLIQIGKKYNLNITVNSVMVNSEFTNVDLGLGVDILDLAVERDRCLKIGRAKDYINDNEFIYVKNVQNRCFTLTRELCIYPNGQVFPCCSPYSYVNNKLLLGNIYVNDIFHCIQNMNKNEIIRKIFKYGVKLDNNCNFNELCEYCTLD